MQCWCLLNWSRVSHIIWISRKILPTILQFQSENQNKSWPCVKRTKPHHGRQSHEWYSRPNGYCIVCTGVWQLFIGFNTRNWTCISSLSYWEIKTCWKSTEKNFKSHGKDCAQPCTKVSYFKMCTRVSNQRGDCTLGCCENIYMLRIVLCDGLFKIISFGDTIKRASIKLNNATQRLFNFTQLSYVSHQYTLQKPFIPISRRNQIGWKDRWK